MSVVLIEKYRRTPNGSDIWRARMDFEVEGKAGTTQTVRVRADHVFRAARLYATDLSSTPGSATKITDIRVEHGDCSWPSRPPRMSTSQFPSVAPGQPARELLSSIFHGKLHIKWDTAQVGNIVEFDVKFDADCKWMATVEGDAIEGESP